MSVRCSASGVDRNQESFSLVSFQAAFRFSPTLAPTLTHSPFTAALPFCPQVPPPPPRRRPACMSCEGASECVRERV